MYLERILIVGGPGSGKTTLGRSVSRRLSVPFYELDTLAYEGGAGAPVPLEERISRVEEMAGQAGWAAEGIYLGWTQRLFEAADVIVWLDLPWRVVGGRIFMRHLKAELRGNNRHKGWRKLFGFMQWARVYYSQRAGPGEAIAVNEDGDETRDLTARYLQPFSARVIRCATPRDVDDWLGGLRS